MRPRERRHRERVPGEEDLVVESGPHPLAAPSQQPLPRGGESGFDPAGRDTEPRFERGIVQHPPQDRPAFPVPPVPNVIGGAEERGVLAEDFLDLRGRPGVVPPLFSLGVGVEGRMERPARIQHLALHPVENAAGVLREPGIPGDPVGQQIDRGEQRVVVEHLLEVGCQPRRIGGIAMEPAAELVEEPAVRHPPEGEAGCVERLRAPLLQMVPEEQRELPAGRELRRRAETSVLAVVGPEELPHRAADRVGGDERSPGGQVPGQLRRLT